MQVDIALKTDSGRIGRNARHGPDGRKRYQGDALHQYCTKGVVRPVAPTASAAGFFRLRRRKRLIGRPRKATNGSDYCPFAR